MSAGWKLEGKGKKQEFDSSVNYQLDKDDVSDSSALAYLVVELISSTDIDSYALSRHLFISIIL